ncbi:MAG: response regulator transcription factor [Nitrospiraceae bacterium]
MEAFELARSVLFGGSIPVPSHEPFEVDYLDRGQAALTAMEAARSKDRPYAVAFVDMRMSPGWDGLETIEHLWKADSRLQVVICTAYSDQPWDEIRERIGRTDKLLDPAEAI